MTPREKVLSIGIGGILALAGCQYMFSKYRTAVAQRETRLAALDMQLFEARDKDLQGALADRQLGEYMARSLPSKPENAKADYKRWLYEAASMVDMRDMVVSDINSLPVGDLYYRHGFKLSGKTDGRGWLELMHLFYSKDYLHRISEMSVQPAREGGLAVSLTIDAIALMAASEEAAEPQTPSPQVKDFQLYADSILNRSFFSGPNQAPRFTSSERLSTEIGGRASLRVTAEDTEKDPLRYEIVGDAPEGLELDSRSGEVRWEPKELGEYSLTVKVTDDGYPRKSSEQRFAIAVVDPPPPPKPAEPAPGFDESTQTVLTALVQGRGDWTAWMKVRTRGTTLKLKPGDAFEIGTLRGTVAEVNSKFVVLEIDGKKFELRPAGVLSEAAKTASP